MNHVRLLAGPTHVIGSETQTRTWLPAGFWEVLQLPAGLAALLMSHTMSGTIPNDRKFHQEYLLTLKIPTLWDREFSENIFNSVNLFHCKNHMLLLESKYGSTEGFRIWSSKKFNIQSIILHGIQNCIQTCSQHTAQIKLLLGTYNWKLSECSAFIEV